MCMYIYIYNTTSLSIHTSKDKFRLFQYLGFINTSAMNTAATAAKLLQSCPTLCDPIDRSPPGSPVPRILQARTLEWAAISSSNA